MGEIANDMISGEICYYCHTFLGKAVGYERSCEECADEDEPREVVTNKHKEENIKDLTRVDKNGNEYISTFSKYSWEEL